MKNLHRDAIRNLDAHWRKPSYPLDFKLIREALVEGEELAKAASDEQPEEMLGLYGYIVDQLFPRDKYDPRGSVRLASAVLLHTMYLRKGSPVSAYRLIATLRHVLPNTDADKEVDERRNLIVRVWWLREHISKHGWSREDVRNLHGHGYFMSPALFKRVQEVVADYEKSLHKPPLTAEQTEDAEWVVANALHPIDEDPAKRICEALAAKGYLTYGY